MAPAHEPPRILDTGLRPPAQNVALARTLIEARAAGEIPDTLQFVRHAPAALLDCAQSAEQELEVERCRAAGLAIQRRITRGSALIATEGDLGWTICVASDGEPRAVVRQLCHAAACGLAALGFDAALRARNEIAVRGRRIAATGSVKEHGLLLVEGLVRIESVPAAGLLRGPVAGDAAHVAEREREVSCAELLGRVPALAQVKALLVQAFESACGAEFGERELTLTEHARYLRALAEVSTEGWNALVRAPQADAPRGSAEIRCAAGALKADVVFDRLAQRLKQVWFSGDAPLRPAGARYDLEAWLADTPLSRLEQATATFFASHPVRTPLAPAQFAAAVRAAAQPVLLAR